MDPSLALSKLNEASRAEPDNLSILLETQSVLIGTGDCSAALKLGDKILETDPYSEMAKLHSAQAAVCLGNFEQSLTYAPADIAKSALSLYWQEAQVERMFKKSEFSEALDKLTQMEKQNPNYPETSYWRWKIEAEQKLKNEKSGQKYVAACRKITPRQFRELNPDPNLCRRVAEVENSLKKSHNP
jgi:tetratricopeptide (TPR) repeat protein